MHTGGKTFRRGTWRILTLNLPISQRNLLWHYKQKHKYQCPSGMQRGTRGPQTPRRRTISSSWALDSRDNSPFLLWETQRLLFLSRSRSSSSGSSVLHDVFYCVYLPSQKIWVFERQQQYVKGVSITQYVLYCPSLCWLCCVVDLTSS